MGGQRAGHALIRAAVGRTLDHAAPVDAVVLQTVIPLGITTNPITCAVALDRLCLGIDGEYFFDHGRQRAAPAEGVRRR
jgi:hypothetical protein